MTRDRIRELMWTVLAVQGKPKPSSDGERLREVGFRSLDFSELLLRVEDELGRELAFEALSMRQVVTVADLLTAVEEMIREEAVDE